VVRESLTAFTTEGTEGTENYTAGTANGCTTGTQGTQGTQGGRSAGTCSRVPSKDLSLGNCEVSADFFLPVPVNPVSPEPLC